MPFSCLDMICQYWSLIDMKRSLIWVSIFHFFSIFFPYEKSVSYPAVATNRAEKWRIGGLSIIMFRPYAVRPLCWYRPIHSPLWPLVPIQNLGTIFRAGESIGPFDDESWHGAVIRQPCGNILSCFSLFEPSGAMPLYGCRLVAGDLLFSGSRSHPCLDLIRPA
jgi:hypothetical protein